MSKIAQLRERRAAKAQEAQALNAKYPAEQRMPKDDADKLDTILAEVEAIDAEIKREDRLNQLAADGDPNAQQQVALAAAEAAGRGNGQSDESKAVRAFFAGGLMNLADADRQRMKARQTPDIRAAMSTSTNTEGGYTVATEWYKSLEIAMKSYGGMRQMATMIRTGTGTAMNFPTADATAEEGEIVGQNAAAGGQDTAFGNATVDVYKYSSKKIALPFELLQDSFLDIEAYINAILAMRLGRITNRHYQTGTGIGQPQGLSVAAGVGKTGATGQTATVTYNDLVDLEHSVDPAYRGLPGVGYVMHDMTLKELRKIKDGNQRPIFVPGYEQGNPGGAPDRLMNRPIVIDQSMPQMAANAKSIGFGALSKYIVRDVMDLTMFRMADSKYIENGQIGFIAFMRSGGNFVDAGGAVKFYKNSAT